MPNLSIYKKAAKIDNGKIDLIHLAKNIPLWRLYLKVISGQNMRNYFFCSFSISFCFCFSSNSRFLIIL